MRALKWLNAMEVRRPLATTGERAKVEHLDLGDQVRITRQGAEIRVAPVGALQSLLGYEVRLSPADEGYAIFEVADGFFSACAKVLMIAVLAVDIVVVVGRVMDSGQLDLRDGVAALLFPVITFMALVLMMTMAFWQAHITYSGFRKRLLHGVGVH